MKSSVKYLNDTMTLPFSTCPYAPLEKQAGRYLARLNSGPKSSARRVYELGREDHNFGWPGDLPIQV